MGRSSAVNNEGNMVESFILNLFFTMGLLFGVISGAFLPSDVYLPCLNYGNISFVTGTTAMVAAIPTDMAVNGGEYYEKAKQSWSKVDSTISNVVVYTASCSIGLLVGSNIGHKVRIKVAEPLSVIGERCNELREKLKAQNEQLENIVQKETRASDIKRKIEISGGVKELNYDSRQLVKKIKASTVKHGSS